MDWIELLLASVAILDTLAFGVLLGYGLGQVRMKRCATCARLLELAKAEPNPNG